MKIGSIFAVKKLGENLFSVQYDDAELPVFEQLFDNWNDVEYLYHFFSGHQSYLQQSFWVSIFRKVLSINEAIEMTLDQADRMETYLLANAESTGNNQYLSSVFVPLLNDHVQYAPLKSAYKTYGPVKPGWLRVYAIKIEDNYIITGGAIKLTRTMQENPLTMLELDRLKSVASELKRLHFTDNTDFDFVYLEI